MTTRRDPQAPAARENDNRPARPLVPSGRDAGDTSPGEALDGDRLPRNHRDGARRHPRASDRPTDAAAAGPQLLALARTVDRTERRVADLETHVRQLVADVARIAGLVAGGPGEERADTETVDEPAAGPPAVRAWLLTADPAQAATDLVDLAAWIDDVYLHYPDAVLASCWLWHPHVVEELWWLRRAHADAYHPQDGTWLRAGDWHDRQRPAVARRVREAIGKCDLSLHIADRQQDRPPAVAPLAGHAVQVATAWAASRLRPAPTRDQLDEAAAYVRALHRTRR